ncbi:ABC transporter ATP-binding protein [Halobaculum sp. D14]|uniref:ABC transporter ATP-binding protein n=1 Tax=Halobaculum sp. D14 TaxID=3421642 RepID=UPI003EBE53B7
MTRDGDDDGLDASVRATFTAPGAEPFTVEMDVSVGAGETLVVLGPSGSGKTLLLETVAGFHDHDGTVRLAGRDLTGTPPENRGFGLVFQEYALFPHMTVRENVAFGARYYDDVRDPDALLGELGVADLADRTPATLSGGEKQRVALARALAIRPDAVLLDEPLSALDVPTRQALRDDLADALSDVTAVYVTHNRTTARALADRIAVVHDGAVLQRGAPDEVFDAPASPFVGEFVGASVVPAAALPDAPEWADTAAVRPEYVRVDPDGQVAGEAVRVTRADAAHRVLVDVDAGGRLALFAQEPPAVGDRMRLSVPPERVTYFEE